MQQTITSRPVRWMRPTALLVTFSLILPVFAGCGGKGSDIPPPVSDVPGSAPMAGAGKKPGLSGKQKVALVAGAALLYYMYKKHQQQAGQTVQYYQSKNGQIYYRDPKTHQAHFVTPPTQAELSQLTPAEQQEMSRYKGYNGQTTGDDYSGVGGADPNGAPAGN